MNGVNQNGWKGKSGVKALQMLCADVAGNIADMVFLRYQHKFDEAFPFLKDGFKRAMYMPFKFMQGPLELVLNKMGSGLEGEENRKQRLAQTSEQRLDGLLETGYHYTAAGLVGLGTLMASEKIMSRAMGSNHVPNKVWWRVDAPVHLGAAIMLGSKVMSPATDKLKGTVKNVMIAAGWTPEKAEQDARFAIAYILPNYLTLIPTTLSMTSMHYAASKGVLTESTHSFHHIDGKKLDAIENPIMRNSLKVLSALGAIEPPRTLAV